MTRKDFANSVLAGLGVPAPRYNPLALGARRAIVAWSLEESGFEPCNGQVGAKFNILNTTLTQPGSTNYNSIPVQNYVSFNSGVKATVDTLKESRYADIVAALTKPGVKADAVCVAVGKSQWGTPLTPLLAVLNTTYNEDRAKYNALTVGV